MRKISKGLTVCAALAVTACASQPAVETATTTSTPMTSSGDVALTDGSYGVWLDSAGGVWVDPMGVLFVAPGGVRIIDLEARTIRMMSDANIAAHIASGDSLEIQLSAQGAGRGQNPDVRNFGQRMVNEHTMHLDSASTVIHHANVTPVRAPFDTTDAGIAMRMMNRLAGTAATTDPHYDRQFMEAQVALHQHMLSELEQLRGQASPALQPLVNNTRRAVREHLLDARRLYRSLGGK